jgi:hypothetical protein
VVALPGLWCLSVHGVSSSTVAFGFDIFTFLIAFFFPPKNKKMPTLDELFSVFKEFLPLITAGGAVVTGLVPRIGPGRAVFVALRSRFAFKPVPESLRSAEIELLKSRLAENDFGQSYLVLTGEKGVGKSCLLRTVTSKTLGVITVKVPAKQDEETIVKKTLQRLTRLQFDFIPPFDSAKRVIFWHRFFTFGRSPIVILEASERKVGQEYADLTGAVRTLVEKYKLRVVVDGSPNSLDESLLRTKRQRVFDIKPMTREMIWQLDQLQDFFEYVKEAGLEDIVFAVLGGNPADYEELWDNTKTHLQNEQDAREVIGTHLCAQIYAAIKLVKDSKSKTNDMDEIIKLFDKDKNLILSKYLTNKFQRPTPDKLFREEERDGVPVLIPASNSIGIVLCHSLTKKPTLNELEELLKKV